MAKLSEFLKYIDPRELESQQVASLKEEELKRKSNMVEHASLVKEIVTRKNEQDQTVTEILHEVQNLHNEVEKVVSTATVQSNSQPEPLSEIEKLCIRWVNRDIFVENMEEFLDEHYKASGVFLSRWQFEESLRRCHEKGLITKVGRRYSPTPK